MIWWTSTTISLFHANDSSLADDLPSLLHIHHLDLFRLINWIHNTFRLIWDLAIWPGSRFSVCCSFPYCQKCQNFKLLEKSKDASFLIILNQHNYVLCMYNCIFRPPLIIIFFAFSHSGGVVVCCQSQSSRDRCEIGDGFDKYYYSMPFGTQSA